VLVDGTAKCWGYNSSGQLGDGTTTNSNVPLTVSGISGAVLVNGGYRSTCVMLVDGTAKCWGLNGYGQVGDGTTTNPRTTPVLVSKGITAIGTATSNNGVGSTSLLIAKPPNTVTNTVMLAGITTRGSITITTPSGWTLLESHLVGAVGQSTYYRVATSADDSVTDYTWTMTSSKASGVIISYENVDPAAPVITSDGLATGASTTITGPTLTTSETVFQSVIFYGIASDDPITAPAGYGTVDEDASTGGSTTTRTRTMAVQKRYTTSGATGAITATLGTARDNVGQHVLLKTAP